jgi:hypothetical protein
MVQKAWDTPCNLARSIYRWQFRIRTFRILVRGWATNEIAAQNKTKVALSQEFTRLESLAETRDLSDEEFGRLRQIEDSLEQI